MQLLNSPKQNCYHHQCLINDTMLLKMIFIKIIQLLNQLVAQVIKRTIRSKEHRNRGVLSKAGTFIITKTL